MGGNLFECFFAGKRDFPVYAVADPSGFELFFVGPIGFFRCRNLDLFEQGEFRLQRLLQLFGGCPQTQVGADEKIDRHGFLRMFHFRQAALTGFQ